LIQEFSPEAVYVTKFAKALKERTHALYGLMQNGKPLPHDHFEMVKDSPDFQFHGITPRQAYIAVSETLMKPLHGNEFWGSRLLDDLDDNFDSLIVVTDSGFAIEAGPIIEAFGEANCTLIRLHREGCNFENDSRSYIELRNVPTFDVQNNGTPIELASELAIILGFELKYRVEVQLPVAHNSLMWFQQGEGRPSFDQALAAVESLRQGDHSGRVFRIMVGKDHSLKVVMPGDAPVAEFV
jgi:hypothetical protein